MNPATTVHTPRRSLDAEMYVAFASEDSTGPWITPLPDLWPGTSNRIGFGWRQSQRGKRSMTEAGDVDGGGSLTRHDYVLSAKDRHQTSTATRSTLIILVKESARAGDWRTFAALVEAIDWSTRGPDELTAAIDTALSLEMASLAIELAQLGGRLFPDHERIQRAAQVLAPPVVGAVRPSRAKGLNVSMAWFEEYANQYRGQWVAVREGQLLAAAESLEELIPSIGDGEDAISTIVTRVL